ncbi:N-acyl-D-aspartate/D-glutamate deacylase [Leptolyngbya sp. 'hensonii']|uniref:N-acyl-D-amino-acid deacylase family protein n=1 Tax=Leptolyngbya sp. 'hensonii' TaxID=1922337 RepID=UPI00094FD41E|nr:amidohydrolase family protein [Leptolyngbya sp. 'hensonii']OLP16302.1 N-acyl-D-aspartate/D-glutamate deacylase [Leptolyngbya sp. 'hensonii']
MDVLIRGGWVFDGLGTPPLRVDLGIQNGRIAAMQPNLAIAAQTVVDASGLWVTPGFVDIHTHYDLELEIAPGLSESVRHGVTTVVIGNCSLSIAIGEPQVLADLFQRVETLSHRLIQKWLQQSKSWQTPTEYLAHLQQLPLGPNVAPLFGHSALRAHVMGLDRSLTVDPSAVDLAAMQQIARDALDAGFVGLSIDMFPWHRMGGVWRGHTIPSQHARFREYAMLADLCRERDRVFQVTPNLQRLASFLDILRMGLGLGRRPLRLTVLSALDVVHDRRLWRSFGPLLWIWNRLLGGNVRFQTLTEPFTIYSDGPVTPLFEEFPAGVQLNNCASRQERQQLWRSAQFRQQFRQDWLGGRRRSFHRQLELMEVVHCPDASWEGLNFAAIAERRQQDPLEGFIQALQDYDTDLRWVATGANDRLAPRLALMSHPDILPGFTDAGAHVRNLGYYDGALSLLKQAVTTGFLTPTAAIHRVTGEPAHWFRLDTGVLKIGARADLVLLDPQALSQPISPPLELSDPLLDGEPRMVKRGSETIVQAVYIQGVQVVHQGQVSDRLGRDSLGTVLSPSPAEHCSAPPRLGG